MATPAETAEHPPLNDPGWTAEGDDPFAERPELYVAASFAGGLAAALVLRWLGRDD